LNQNKPWCEEECLRFFLDQRKQTETQWLQDLYQSNTDNLNNVRREDSRHFRNKIKKYLKAKIEEHETNSKIKNSRDFNRSINDFKKGHQLIINIVKDENCDLATDSHSIWLGGGNIFSATEYILG